MLKKLELTLGERQVLGRLFASFRDCSPLAAGNTREVRRKFKLRDCQHEVGKLGDDLKDYGAGVQWDDMVDPLFLTDRLREILERDQEDLEKARGAEKPDEKVIASIQERETDSIELIKRIEKLDQKAVYTLDSTYLTWLKEKVIDTVDLSKQWVTEFGRASEIDAPVSSGLLELFADLCDAIRDAEDVRPKEE